MQHVDMQALCDYAKRFSDLDEAKINTLRQVYPDISSRLQEVTDLFYKHLQQIPKTVEFIEGRVDTLKQTHVAWLNELFSGNFNAEYTAKLYHVGDVHVKVKLPVEFMAGAMTIIQSEMIRIFGEIYANNPAQMVEATRAFNAAVGFSLLVMQESYQSSSMAEELEKFLRITGMSRVLFNNLARAYK